MSTIDEILSETTLKELDELETKIDEFNNQQAEEEKTMNAKYSKLRAPLLSKVHKIFSTIPNFWITTFKNHPALSSLLDEASANVIENLTLIEVERNEEDPTVVKISFHFKDNEYFSAQTVVREQYLVDGDVELKAPQLKFKSDELKEKALNPEHDHDHEHEDGEECGSANFFLYLTSEHPSELDDIVADDLYTRAAIYYHTPLDEMFDFGDENGHDEDDEDDEDEEDDQPSKRSKN